MLVRKILETTLTAGQTSVQFTDSTIPNSLIRVFCNDESLVYTSMSLLGNTLTITYPAQTVNKNIALEIVKAGLSIANDLNTDDSTQALSAAQGVALKTLINNLDLEDLYNVSISLPSDGDMIVYASGEWINVASKNNITDMDDVDVSSIQDGQILAWDEDEEKFVNVYQSSGGDYTIYTESEQEVGIWIDEKKIYRRVLTGSITPGTGTYSVVVGTLSDLGISEIIRSFGFIENTQALYKMAVPSYVNSTNASGVYVSGDGNIRLYVTGTYHQYTLVIEYTKSA